MTRNYIALGMLGMVAVPWAWSAIASLIYLQNMGFGDGWEFPWLQIWDELVDVRNNGLPHGVIGAKVVLSLILATALPTLIVIAVVRLAVRRGRSRLTALRGGKLRPLVPGVTDNHGHARILPNRECLRRFPGPEGVVIGELHTGRAGTAPLVIDPITTDAGNGLLVAGNGAGKSQSLATMAMYWPGSAVILDPKVELAQMLREALEAKGKRVHVVNMTDPASGFNVIGWLNKESPVAELKSCISWIYPDEKDETPNRDPYFEPTARALCAVLLADIIWDDDLPPGKKTLATLRDRVATPETLMKKALAAIAKNSKSPYAKQVARTLMDITPKQWSGVYGGAVTNTEWLADLKLARMVSGDSFPVSDILDGNTVIFAQLPLKVLAEVPGLGRVMIGSMLNTVYDAEGRLPARVGFFLDEAWLLKRMQIQKSATVTGRSFGITLIWFYQSVAQIEEAWGDNVSTLYNNLAWRAYAAVKDRKLAQEISEDFGEMSVMAWSEGDNQGVHRPPGLSWGSRSTGTNASKHEIKRRVLLPQEITGADPTDLFVIAGNVTMRLRTPMAHLREEFAGVVQPSPHYQALALTQQGDQHAPEQAQAGAMLNGRW